jgi:hypothetical protein
MRTITSILTFFSISLPGVLLGAMIDLTIFNSTPLVDVDGLTLLQGDATTGDLVQLLFAGPDGMIDPASRITGGATGDDILLIDPLNPFHVGAGQPVGNTGQFDLSGIQFDDSLIGEFVYVRFWNDPNIQENIFYGNSILLDLPAGDAFGQAELDFVTGLPDPHQVNVLFTFREHLAPVPEPWVLQYALFGVALFWLRNRIRQEQVEQSDATTS